MNKHVDSARVKKQLSNQGVTDCSLVDKDLSFLEIIQSHYPIFHICISISEIDNIGKPSKARERGATPASLRYCHESHSRVSLTVQYGSTLSKNSILLTVYLDCLEPPLIDTIDSIDSILPHNMHKKLAV